jgi:D-alanyl-D-alanine carboxypeptidase
MPSTVYRYKAMLQKFLLVFCLSCIGISQSVGQTVIPRALDSAFNRILLLQRNALGVKSLSASVIMPGNATWAGAYGVSSLFPLDSVKPDYAYAIGSVTKTITGACILQLVDEGRLRLDDSLGKWLPAFPHTNPRITIRQLLLHQSGLYDVITNPAYNQASLAKPDSVWQLSNLLRDYMRPPLFAPGAGWSYSNTGYILLGLIIEKITGNSYRAEFKKRFFEPLGLKSLVITPYDPRPKPVAHVWIDLGGDGVTDDAHFLFSEWNALTTTAGPAGGYYATARELAIWNRAFIKGQFHSEQIMAQAKISIPTSSPARHGLGLMERSFVGLTGYGHGGDIAYASTSFHFPERDITITVMNNDQRRNSWALASVVQGLLRAYIEYTAASVSTTQPLSMEEAIISPNPFTHELSVSMELPSEVNVAQAVLINPLGQEVARRVLGRLPSGTQNIMIGQLDALPQGLYFLSLNLDGRPTRAVQVVRS